MEFAARRTITEGLSMFPITLHIGLSSPGPDLTSQGRKEKQSETWESQNYIVNDIKPLLLLLDLCSVKASASYA